MEGHVPRTHYSKEIRPEMDGEEVVAAGWVHERRDLGGLLFLILRDREGFVQVTLRKDRTSEKLLECVKRLSKESVVSVRGIVRSDKRAPNGCELIPKEIKVLSVAETPLPLEVSGRIRSELDTRLDVRFLDLRIPRNREIFRIRSEVLKEIRRFLDGRGFIEVNTPKIVAAATEGGTALFPISYFEREAFLSQSPQLYKQMLMATGLDRVYEIAPIFRAEEHDTTRHLNEATSADIEAAFADHEWVMRTLEALIASVYENIRENSSGSLEVLGVELPEVKPPFERITYTEALELLAERSVELEWGEDLSTAAEKTLGEIMGAHYFIVEWPTSVKPYYTMPFEGREEVCKAFDLMHPRMELASGSQRIHDYEMLRASIERCGLSPESFKFYLDAFRYGMPPHAGWGLGVERLLMTMLEIENIREVILFPRDRKRLVP
ncbi:MAG: Aspartyl/asparaginyl-tRNA synthetase [Candidatus Alkanophagales archaeon MCA70_species_2]|nr:Aspartyl/asparaginyl-tRNA synthetase [Candidatus Alkanophaga liquidiphilum]